MCSPPLKIVVSINFHSNILISIKVALLAKS